MTDITELHPEYFECVWRRCAGVVLDSCPPIEPFRCIRCKEEVYASDHGKGYDFPQRVCPAFDLETV